MKYILLSVAILRAGLARAEAPYFTVQPGDAIADLGETVEFATVVSGTEPISCQWFFNATNPIPDATSCTLAVAAAQAADAGLYTLVASNAEGCVTSRAARLVVCDKVWTGGGDGVSWSSGANWSGGTVPAAGQSVYIGEGSNAVNYAGGTLGNLLCRRPLTWQGSTTVTGLVQVTQMLSFSSGITLTASGSNSRLTASANGTLSYVSFNVTGGAQVILSGVQDYNALGYSASWSVTGSGSLMSMPSLQSLKGPSAQGFYLSLCVLAGGRLSLTGVTSIVGCYSGNYSGARGTTVLADGTNSVVDLSSLTAFTGGQDVASGSSMEPRNGGQILVPKLGSTSGLSLRAAGGMTFSLPSLTNYQAGAYSSPSLISTGAGSLLDLPSLHTVSGPGAQGCYLSAQALAGGRLSLTGVTSIVGCYSGGYSGARGTTVLADGTNSVVDLSSLTAFTGGQDVASGSSMEPRNGGQILVPNLGSTSGLSLRAAGGMTFSIPSLTSYQAGTYSSPSLISTGVGSLLDLPSLQMVSGPGAQGCYLSMQALAGGRLSLTGVTNVLGCKNIGTYPGARGTTVLADGTNSVVDLSSLTAFTGGQDVASGSSMEPRNGGQILVPNLGSTSGLSLRAAGGMTFSLPSLTNYQAGAYSSPTLISTGAGSLLDLPSLHTVSGPGAQGCYLIVEALSGGHLKLNAVTTIIGSYSGGYSGERGTRVLADGTDSLIELQQLQLFRDTTSSGSSYMRELNDGIILRSPYVIYDGVEFYLTPCIYTLSQDFAVPVHSNATFSVTADGTTPLWYQWYYGEGTEIEGATNSTLTVTDFQESDVGDYWVTVSNVYGVVTSQVATLSPAIAPVILQQPVSQRVNVGAPAQFTVEASGTPELNCQWRLNGVEILGATGMTFSVENVAFNDVGLYDVEVRNNAGSVLSEGAWLALTVFASGGDCKTNDTYVYHTFKSNGVFQVQAGGVVECLVVAGGGQGGGRGDKGGGGGGAGGLIYERNCPIASGQAIAVTVGKGGSGAGSNQIGYNGQNSIFGALTAIGGGGGAAGPPGSGTAQHQGQAGGSGGGSSEGRSSGGAGVAGQGYAGGRCDQTGGRGGGGGGAGEQGKNSSVGAGGGDGRQIDILGTNIWYAGGGAGGDYWNGTGGVCAGGLGGGGNSASAGAANTGGGGGGGNAAHPAGGNGGSGIVIVRYPLYLLTSELVVSGTPLNAGMPTPYNYGSYAVERGKVVTNFVSSPASGGWGTQYVSKGWVGTGSAPSVGVSTNVTFTLTNDSSIVWQWQTQYRLSAATNGCGVVTGSGWYDSGSNVTLTATEATYWHFAGWSGDTNDCTITGNSITVTMSLARSIIANFTVEQRTLSVLSSLGGECPGTVTTNYSTMLSQYVTNSPVSGGVGTQYVCAAGSVAGNTFTQVGATNVVLTLTNNAVLTWQWATNFRLEVETNGPGRIVGGDKWVMAYSNATLSAAAAGNYRFVSWSGDTDLIQGGNLSNESVTVSVSRPVNLTANFAFDRAIATSNLLLWLRADSILGVANGQSISSWPDLSLYGRSVTPYRAAPTLATALLNGKPAVRFNGLTSFQVPDSSAWRLQNLTIFVVARRDTPWRGDDWWSGIMLGQDQGAGSNPKWSLKFTESASRNVFSISDGVLGTVSTSFSLPFDQFGLFELHKDGPRKEGYFKGRLTDSSDTAGTGQIIDVATPLYIGFWETIYDGAYYTKPLADSGFHGYIAELLIYNAAISDEERQEVGAYLAEKYGFTGAYTLPSVSQHPRSQVIPLGTNASFSVVAFGTAPLSYQWSFNSTNLVGETNMVLNLVSIQATDAGNYRAIISNPLGCVTSSVATLTIATCPVITAQPTNVTVRVGGQAVFKVTATGNPSPGYQWRHDGTNMAGKTSSTLTLSSTTVADRGYYDVVVTNNAGAVISDAALLTFGQYLSIASAYGVPEPPVGSQTWFWGDCVTCRVSKVETAGTKQYACTGWKGTGSVPTFGATTNVSFTITNDSSIVWQWATNYWLAVATNGPGHVTGGDRWVLAGSNATLSAEGDANWHFVSWSCDTAAIQNGSLTDATVTVTLDGPVSLTANFAIDSYPVTFDLLGRGARTGGGELAQEVAYGGAAEAPEVAADPGWAFEGWDAAFGCVTNALTVQAVYTPQVVVTNVVANQRPGTKLVDIGYDLYYGGTNALTVGVAISNAAGVVTASSFSGDVGAGVTNGLQKHVVWDAGADQNGLVLTGLCVQVSAAVTAPSAGNYMVVDLSAGPAATNYPVTYLADAPAGGWSDEYKTTKLVLRRIPAGTFVMGSPTNELGREADEDQHNVELTEEFHIGVYEVTQRQWELVTGTRPSYFDNITCYSTRPVEQVSYYDVREKTTNENDPSVEWPANREVNAVSFIGKLRAKSGLLELDLPTEAQWEYACRAGTTSSLNSGKNLTDIEICPNVAEVGRYWFNGGSGYSKNCTTSAGTAAVGSYVQNAWGLFDMHGNVGEWCLDWFGDYQGNAIDPKGPMSGTSRVGHGGSWGSHARNFRSANRGVLEPSLRLDHMGVRVTCTRDDKRMSGTYAKSMPLDLDSRDYTTTVDSAFGSPTPAVGLHTNYCWHSAVTCAVESAVCENGTNATCTGWTGTGSIAPHGATTNVVAILTNVESSITWKWEPAAYYVSVGTNGVGGAVSGGGAWVEAGGYAVLTATPDAGYRFWRWTDGAGNVLGENGVYTNWVAGAASVFANFLLLPTGAIDTVAPANPVEGAELTLSGHGGGDYAVEGYCWSVERLVDGVPDGQARAFCWSQSAVTTLPAGEWRVSFQVCDVMGSWSAPVTRDVSVAAATTLSDLQVSREDVRFLNNENRENLEIGNVRTGETVCVAVAVHNTGSAETPGPVLVTLYEGFGPTNLASQTPAALTVVATGTVAHVAAGGVETAELMWTVTGQDGPRTLTVVAEYASNHETAVSNGVNGLSEPLPVAERTLANNLASAMTLVGDIPTPPNLIVVTVQAGTMYAGRAGTVSGRATYGWGQAYPVLGALVEVEVEGVSYVTHTRSPDGSFAVTVTAPAVGTHTATARVYDGFAAGDASCAFACVPVPSSGGGRYWPPDTAPNLVIDAVSMGGDGAYQAESLVPHVQMGSNVIVRALVRNASGFACGGDFEVAFGVGGQPLGAATVAGGLGANEARWVAAPIHWLPVAAGTVTVTAEADSGGAVVELSEYDNARSQAVAVREPRPDLRPYRIVWNGTGWDRVSGLSWSPADPVAGEEVQVSATVYNCGTLSCTQAFDVALWCDGVEVTRSNVAESMGVGESKVVDLLWPTAAVPPGTHTLQLVVDAAGDVDELEENNNTTARSVRLYPDAAAPVPYDLTVSPYPTVGDPCVLTARIRNEGGEAYAGGAVSFYVQSPAYALIGEGAVGPLAMKGGEGTASAAWTPDALGPVRVYVSVEGRVYSEVFNVGEIPPDLRVLSEDIVFDPAAPQAGDDVRVRASVRNASASIAATNVYVSFDVAVGEGVYAPLGSPRWLGVLVPGESASVYASAALGGLGRGVYIVRVTLVSSGQGDADGGDNAATRSFGVESPVADAGADRACVLGETVALDGSGSSNASEWLWRVVSAPAGSEAGLAGADTAAPAFTPDIGGNYRIELTVGAGGAASVPDAMTLSVTGVVVTTTAGAHGAVAPSGTVVVATGSRPTFAMTPAPGYRVSEVLADGASVGAVESYTFAPAVRNHTLFVQFQPIPITGLAAQVLRLDAVLLSWSYAGPAEAVFRVERSVGGGAWQTLTTVDTRMYEDDTVSEGQSLRYRVTALIGGVGLSSVEIDVAVPRLPAVPTGVGATAVSSSEVSVFWNAAARATGYEVQRRVLPLGEWTVAAALGDVTVWTDGGVAAGGRYAYRVRGVNAAGNSAFSAEVSVTVPDEPGAWGYGLLVSNMAVTVSGEALAPGGTVLCGAPFGGVFDALLSNPQGVFVQHRVVVGLRDAEGLPVGTAVEVNELTGVPAQPPAWVAEVAVPPGLRVPAEAGTYVLWVEDSLGNGDPREAFAAAMRTNETELCRAVGVFEAVPPAAGDACVAVGASSERAGRTVEVPIMVSAMGGENAFSFSLNYDPSKLRLLNIQPGAAMAGCYLEVNDETAGAAGVLMLLPVDVGLEAGLLQLATVRFQIDGSALSGEALAMTFGDDPAYRMVVDAYANLLPHVWLDGTVTVTAPGYEADVSPRGTWDGRVNDKDKAQIMRFATGLDTPSAGDEFQRADCAPIATRGDGRVDVRDAVIATRYASGVEPLKEVGGPAEALAVVGTLGLSSTGGSPVPLTLSLTGTATDRDLPRLLASGLLGLIKIEASFGWRGEVVEMPVSVVSGGNIEGSSFTVLFDPNELVFLEAEPGPVCSNALRVVNAAGAPAGMVGYAMRMPPGRALPAGSAKILTLRFRAAQAASEAVTSVGFAAEPTPLVLSDGAGGAVTASVQGADVYLLPLEVEGRPATVGDLTAMAEGRARVRLTWSDVADEAGYAVYRRSEREVWGLLSELPAGAHSYVDDGLEPGLTYAYRVISVNAAGENSSDPVSVTLPTEYRFWADTRIGLSLGEPGEDQDGDGACNYLEYLMGTDPAVSETGLLRTGFEDIYGFGEAYFTLSVDVYDWALPSLSVEATDDLREGVWQTAAEVGNAEVDGKRRLMFRSQRPVSDAPHQFIRLQTVR